MRKSWEGLKHEAHGFFDEVDAFLTELGINKIARGFKADHLGLRFADPADVLRIKSQMQKEGTAISSAQVNGREILIIALAKPLMVGDQRVPAIELPYPKTNHTYQDGWEHVEFVIPCDAKDLESFRKVFDTTFPGLRSKIGESRIHYAESMPHADSDQLPNPTIELTKRLGLTIKFHPRSIQEVVA